MNLGAIFIGLALLVLVIPLVIGPFRGKRHRKLPPPFSADASPSNHRQQVLLSLRDLDFDYQTEKINEEDYTRVRTQLLFEAANTIQSEQQEKVRIEELVRAGREAASPTEKCPQCGRPFRAGDKFCPGCGSYLTARCQSCNHANQPADKFCTNCGIRLNDRLEQG